MKNVFHFWLLKICLSTLFQFCIHALKIRRHVEWQASHEQFFWPSLGFFQQWWIHRVNIPEKIFQKADQSVKRQMSKKQMSWHSHKPPRTRRRLHDATYLLCKVESAKPPTWHLRVSVVIFEYGKATNEVRIIDIYSIHWWFHYISARKLGKTLLDF